MFRRYKILGNIACMHGNNYYTVICSVLKTRRVTESRPAVHVGVYMKRQTSLESRQIYFSEELISLSISSGNYKFQLRKQFIMQLCMFRTCLYRFDSRRRTGYNSWAGCKKLSTTRFVVKW